MAMSTTIRISSATRDRFAAMSKQTGRPMSELLDHAATAMERELFFTSLEQGYDRLRNDPGAWAEITAERESEAPSVSDSSS